MHKALRYALNILLIIAGAVFVVFVADYAQSVKYANREVPDETASKMGVFDYRLKHKAYGEITNSHFTDRNQSMEAEPGLEIPFITAEYANYAFMKRIYAERKDDKKVRDCDEKMRSIRTQLGDRLFAADEIDAIIRTAP